VKIDYWRQLGILPPSELAGKKVTVIGVGGIGSPTTLAMAKTGFPEITIYDPDVVDAHNLPNQLYRLKDVGKLKVLAMQEIVADYSETTIVPVPELFTDKNKPKGYVISAVDSMAARYEIWKTIKYNIQVPIYIDARMGAEVLKMYTVRPTDPKSVSRYEQSLHSDEKAFKAPCTQRAIAYTVFIAAGFITNQVKLNIMGQDYKWRIIIDIRNSYLW
jgi:molybdopterin/thiamine biosynthesis adenylyltransferase